MDPEVTKDHELVKAKVSAGLPLEDAIEVATRQLEHDAALKAAAKKSQKKTDSPSQTETQGAK